MSDAVADDGDRGDDRDSPLVAAAAGAVTLVTLGVAFGLLALGQSYFWVAFPVGFGGGMPLAVGLARWYESDSETGRPQQGRADTDTALADLRARYARGELDDQEFESRVERLLETESVADAKSFAERTARTTEDGTRSPESERAADRAAEDDRT